MQILAFILMLLAFFFMVWGIVSLVVAIVRKVKAKKQNAVAEDAALDSSEKGED